MHEKFADLYQKVSTDATPERLKVRWAGVKSFTKGITAADIVELTAVFFRLETSQEFLERFRAAFKSTDETFLMSGNDEEVAVLAGASLTAVFDSSAPGAEAAALGLVCGDVAGARKSVDQRVVDAAKERLMKRSAGMRAATSAEAVSFPNLDISAHVTALKAVPAGQAVVDPVSKALEALASASSALVGWARNEELSRRLLREESDVLWWLFGEKSRQLDVHFSKVPTPALCLVGAADLFQLVRVIPGPYAGTAFLAKMLQLGGCNPSDKITLKDAVSGCKREWHAKLVLPLNGSTSKLCPTVLAITKAGENPTDGAWVTPFQTLSAGIEANINFRHVDLSAQYLNEALFLRALREMGEG